MHGIIRSSTIARRAGFHSAFVELNFITAWNKYEFAGRSRVLKTIFAKAFMECRQMCVEVEKESVNNKNPKPMEDKSPKVEEQSQKEEPTEKAPPAEKIEEKKRQAEDARPSQERQEISKK